MRDLARRPRYHRPHFFGKPFCELAQAVMRGPSPWTIGERELFAAFVSARNRCQFCAITHEAIASAVLDPSIAAAVGAGWRAASVEDRVRAILGLLEKLTLTPDEVGPLDVRAVLDAGVSPEAIHDAIAVWILRVLAAFRRGGLLPGRAARARSGPAWCRRG